MVLSYGLLKLKQPPSTEPSQLFQRLFVLHNNLYSCVTSVGERFTSLWKRKGTMHKLHLHLYLMSFSPTGVSMYLQEGSHHWSLRPHASQLGGAHSTLCGTCVLLLESLQRYFEASVFPPLACGHLKPLAGCTHGSKVPRATATAHLQCLAWPLLWAATVHACCNCIVRI